MHTRSRIFALLATLAACSCVSDVASRPTCGRVFPKNGKGVVLCSTFDQVSAAAITAATIDDYYLATGEALGYVRGDYPEIWLVAEISWQGLTLEDHIVFDPTGGTLEFASLIMAHEFVHWHSEGTAMQRNLPHGVMEGVSEWIAVDLT